jgi:1,4-dihydroxy-2-naphthoyl-CoA synthase
LDELAEIYTTQLMETYDANEGIDSFLEKRKPNWKDS